jgi:adenylyltransferase/sulfurtransferase
MMLVDHDRVELSNLQRQIAHGTADIDQPKVESAGASARCLNPDVQLELVNQMADAKNLPGLIRRASVVVDGTDNLATRQLVNQLCYQLEVPLVSGSAIGIEGQLMVVDGSRDTSCYQCLYHEGQEQPLNCAESGVLAPLVGVIGSLQAVETIKVLLGQHEPGKLHLYDAWAGQFRQLALPKRPGCPVCGANAKPES